MPCILWLNQDQFKKRLATVSGANVRPDYDALSEDMHMYAESTEIMKVIPKDYNVWKVLLSRLK